MDYGLDVFMYYGNVGYPLNNYCIACAVWDSRYRWYRSYSLANPRLFIFFFLLHYRYFTVIKMFVRK